MMETPAPSLLRKVFEKYPDIQAVYLFGSTARGSVHQESDLDLACAGFCNVDLVFMKENDIVLQYEAIRQNILVYESANFDRGATYSVIVRKYLDFYHYLNIQREAYKKRILNDTA